jgi:NAD(P)-dependent dehydrogenase (short-subunit alcohol dehydrogenase family)
LTIEDKAVLVTGANRGIGQALVAEALRRGAKRVYARTRQFLPHVDERVTPVTLDVTRGGRYVPSMRRKHSSNGRRSWIRGRNSGAVHRQVQKIFRIESFPSVSNKGEMIWQHAKRETRSGARKGISR